jgi:hypothetical protein
VRRTLGYGLYQRLDDSLLPGARDLLIRSQPCAAFVQSLINDCLETPRRLAAERRTRSGRAKERQTESDQAQDGASTDSRLTDGPITGPVAPSTRSSAFLLC